MDPSFLSQLGHDGVDEGEAGAGFLPSRQVLRVVLPRDLERKIEESRQRGNTRSDKSLRESPNS